MVDTRSSLNKSLATHSIIHLSPKRWLILALFILYAACNAMQWMQYSIIANIISKYYGVTAVTVDWTSIVMMVTYLPLVVPVSLVIDKMGLRCAALIGSIGTAVGSWIKVFSASPELFYVTFIGQTVLSISQVFILSLPSRIAAVWFGENEASRACALGVFGSQLGFATGFLIPSILVKDHDSAKDVGNDLQFLYNSVAGYITPVTIGVILFFDSEPSLPPSRNQQLLRYNKKGYSYSEFFGSLKRLLSNSGFVMLMFTYGLNVGVFSAIATLLNQFVLSYLPHMEEDAGKMGMCMIVVGIIGSVILGFILDKTHKFKAVTFWVYFMSTAGCVVFMYSLESRIKPFMYITCSLLGLFLNGYLVVGFEMGVELTFPESESTTSGLLNSMAQAFGALLTVMLGWLFQKFGAFWALVSMAAVLALGSLVTWFIPNESRRQAVMNQQK